MPALSDDDWAAEHGDDVKATEAALFGEMIDRVAPLPGARAFLELLHARGHPVVLGSSANAHDLDVYLDLLGARDLVQAWTTSPMSSAPSRRPTSSRWGSRSWASRSAR